MRYMASMGIPENIVSQSDFYRSMLSKYVVGEAEAPMQCPIFVGEFNLNRRSNISRTINQILKAVKVNGLSAGLELLDVVDANCGRTELVANIRSSSELTWLHKSVAGILGDIVDRNGPPDLSRFPENETAERLKSYFFYGSPEYGDFWKPRVPFFQVRPEIVKEHPLVKSYSLKGYNWKVDRIILSQNVDSAWEKVKVFEVSG